MAKTNAERQAEYRARKREAGLCLDCSEPSGRFARCKVHRDRAADYAIEARGSVEALEARATDIFNLTTSLLQAEGRIEALERELAFARMDLLEAQQEAREAKGGQLALPKGRGARILGTRSTT